MGGIGSVQLQLFREKREAEKKRSARPSCSAKQADTSGILRWVGLCSGLRVMQRIFPGVHLGADPGGNPRDDHGQQLEQKRCALCCENDCQEI